MDRAADNHYPTMTVEQTKQLKIPAAENCVLFLWATVPMLPEALEVMRAVYVSLAPGLGERSHRHRLLAAQ